MGQIGYFEGNRANVSQEYAHPLEKAGRKVIR